MKKLILLLFVIILTACSPRVIKVLVQPIKGTAYTSISIYSLEKYYYFYETDSMIIESVPRSIADSVVNKRVEDLTQYLLTQDSVSSISVKIKKYE